jgi:alkaline phosphatase D
MQTRRQLLRRGAGAAAASVLVPHAAWAVPAARPRLYRGGRFAQGVLSGEPAPRAITLLTLLDDVGGRGSVRLEVARDRGFDRIVAARDIATWGARNFSVKARVKGLDPYEQYYYRFETKNEQSPVGRFRTALPPDSRQPVRFAFFSCAEWSNGFFNAYELMAQEDDLDFVVNLGDYIYTEAYDRVAAVRADTIGRDVDGTLEAYTLADYRAKYALYRSDQALRAMHAKFPTISIWDDHEWLNNVAGGAADGGLPASENATGRRAAAYRAFFESMPMVPVAGTSSRIYRGLRFGRTIDLLMLDQRQYRSDQPCSDPSIPQDPANVPDCEERRDPDRNYLGDRQMSWLKRRLASSQATWKVIANQAPIMPLKSGPDRYGIFDPWQGYLAERDELVGHIGDEDIAGVVFATGDLHTFMAGDVRPGESASRAATVATEFHSGSITSLTLGEGEGGIIPGVDPANPNTPQALYDFLLGVNPWIDAADVDHHGYGVMEASRTQLKVAFRRLATIKRRSTSRIPDMTWTVRPKKPSIKGQDGDG